MSNVAANLLLPVGEDMEQDDEDLRNPAVAIAVLRQQVRELREWRTGFTADLMARMTAMDTKMDLVIAGRPTWAVSIVIAILMSALSASLMAIFRR